MDLFFLIIGAIVAVVPSYAHDRRSRPSYNRLTDINTYSTSNRRYDNNRNVVAGSGCYERCYDAYCRGSYVVVSGCVCSRYDFVGIVSGGGCNERRYIAGSCGCPSGTSCVRTNGIRRCVSRRSNSRSSYNDGYSTSYRVRNSIPINTGLPRQVGGHCGYLSTVCQASQRDLNQQVRFSYDYRLGRCVRERVHSLCSPLGARNNIFTSLRTCNRMCL